MAREVLQKNDEVFSGQKVPDSMALSDHMPNAVAWISTGELWRTIRCVLSIFLTSQQKLDSLRDLRQTMVQEMVQHVKVVGERGECVDIGKLAFTTAFNQMSNTCFSVNVVGYVAEDFFKGFYRAVKTIMEIDAKFNIGDYFPLIKGLDLQGIRRKSKEAYGFLDELCNKFITERLKDRESKMRKRTETSSITTECTISELIRQPHKMEKLCREIADSVGAKGKIEESEIVGLPYLQAVVKETLRLHLAVPLLLPHKTEKQVIVYGYEIPKDT
ncbi:hypothetical protein LguiA_033678 [Lonicera macranthoides]